MTGFQAAPESFPVAANRLRDVVQGVVEAWGPVREHTASIRFGRGDDLLSPLVQVSLQGAVQLIERSVATAVQHLDEVATGLERMGQQYAQAEDETRRLVDGVQRAAFG